MSMCSVSRCILKDHNNNKNRALTCVASHYKHLFELMIKNYTLISFYTKFIQLHTPSSAEKG